MTPIGFGRPSPALAVACLALAVALGGTSYAAVVLPKNSVGTAQLKKRAVTGAKVKARTLGAAHFKAGQLPAGPPGPAGPQGPAGSAGAAGGAGPQGPPGLSEYEIVTATGSTVNAYFGGAVATCPGGKRAIGGGASTNLSSFQSGPVLRLSMPSSGGTAWSATTQIVGCAASSWTTFVYAVCARVS